ncbi:hypothetical protein CSQ85_03100 [Bifidobacterium rousetti]|uniref:endonuclease domain-containing protein n=1 Tax=Bifidobacterium rousetti TaxID=2045439 RepID=UPI00123AEC72|nr:DUF559 domain-containing protein [Bifidobacterium rousetti]KAA8819716.1 hypothetical protein CSQ85_03100 [Bifidobacterium rousetti]
MNGYNAVPQNGEVRDYVRNGLEAQATAKLAQCWEIMSRFRTDRKVWFSLHTALELCRIERPRYSTLPNSSFYVTVRSGNQRSTFPDVSFHIWNQPFKVLTFPNGVSCMHPIDVWIQFAQYLNVDELIVLLEAIIRRGRYPIDAFANRLTAFHRIVGRQRCEAALRIAQSSDSVQETRARLALLRFGLSAPTILHVIIDPSNSARYTVDMAYPRGKVAIEYDGDHHRRFRAQYVRDQQKRRRLRQMGWTVIEVFADDLMTDTAQRDFAQQVADALKTPLPGRPQLVYRSLADPKLAIHARKGEYARMQARENARRR